MYFIFEMIFNSDKAYICRLIKALAVQSSLEVEIRHTKEKIILIANKDAASLEAYLKLLEESIPASIYLGESRHYFSDEKPSDEAIVENDLPIDIGLCPTCQKEMFNVSSRRYYYPFTSCNACGSQHAFLTQHPMRRENSNMKFLAPCEACQKEQKQNPLRQNLATISCIDCGIALKMRNAKKEHIANDKGSYRKLFEVTTQALLKGKSVKMKTTHGDRLFFVPTPEMLLHNSTLLVTEAGSLNRHFMIVVQEFNALLSIERPMIRVATKSEEMKALYGSSSWVKYPDDGMTMLLAKELQSVGCGYIAYRACDEMQEADYVVDFDIPVAPQEDFKLFINQDTKLLVGGTRSIFPTTVHNAKKERIVLSYGMASVWVEDQMIIDRMDHFSKMAVKDLWIRKDEPIEVSFENQYRFEDFKASMLGILVEHEALKESAIGVHFDQRLHFLYYNKVEVMDVVPPQQFEADRLFDEIAVLREGSDRLVVNYQKAYPKTVERLNALHGEHDIFEVTAIILGLQEESFDGISTEALRFLGKGGLQIDTKVKDNRFNDYSFLASIMSYQLSGVESDLICYSIYESFGDYIADIVTQLMEKTKATRLTLSGKTFANQSLWGRIQRNLGAKHPLLNRSYPIGKESVIFGANYL
ncbi:MAG: hypothetical protein K0U47_00055 [Epsilonproteobacteria bacterium]|nr:hypothetical protein [Campylobacterota bacterium]